MSEEITPLVNLIQCGRQSCGHVLLEEERHWKPDGIGERAICPRCGNCGFYTLKANGQKVTRKEMAEYRNGVDPRLIEATPRMGPKMRKELAEAKARALNL